MMIAGFIAVGLLWPPLGRSLTLDDAKDLSDAFPKLKDLKDPYHYNPVGGLDFQQCCLRAVKDSYHIKPGTNEWELNRDNGQTPFIDLTPDELKTQQFPCGAEYKDNPNGAPLVRVPYRWCKDNCDGWQRSHNAKLSEWVQPFVGYILPAAVFALSVPRKRTLNIPDFLFPTTEEFRRHVRVHREGLAFRRGLNAFLSAIWHVFFSMGFDLGNIILRAAVAAFIGFLDTLMWTAIVFSTAAPMILSGLYEANVDRQVITYIEKSMKEEGWYFKTEEDREEWVKEKEEEAKRQRAKEERRKRRGQPKDSARAEEARPEPTPPKPTGHSWTSLQHKVHLMYAVLVGNLQLDVGPPQHIPRVETKQKDEDQGPGEAKLSDQGEGHGSESNADDEMEYADAWHDIRELVDHLRPEAPEGDSVRSTLETTRGRLHTMLGSQQRFGITVGAALAFFLGSFLVNVYGNRESLGDNNTSHALAFGEWWMTIPFVAIVGGCLLAGNNPNTLEGVMTGTEFGHTRERKEPETPTPEDNLKVKDLKTWLGWKLAFRWIVMPQQFGKVYEPVWMWERGRNKRRWVQRVQRVQHEREQTHPEEHFEPGRSWLQRRYSRAMEKVRIVTKREANKSVDLPHTTLAERLIMLLLMVALILIPFLLAFLTSYHTPIVGLGCRSFTFVLYFTFQILLCLCWLVDFRGTRAIFASRPVPENPHVTESSPEYEKDEREIDNELGKWAYGTITFCCLFLSVFSAIVGTFLQISGVFRNCKCDVPMAHWSDPDDFLIPISSNTPDNIKYADEYWTNNGIAAIVLLAIVCYLGWWYQRHWRLRLTNLIDAVMFPGLPEKLLEGSGVRSAAVMQGQGTGDVATKREADVAENEIEPVRKAD